MRILLFSIIYSFCLQVWGTAQISDVIEFEGESLRLYVNPLEIFYKKHPDRRLKNLPTSTALWRGYIATFSFQGKKLILKEMESQEWDEGRPIDVSIINRAFPKLEERNLDWFTGVLVCPKGELVNYRHMGYASEYEKYTVILVKNGKLEDFKHFSLRKYRKYKWKQFKAYKKTDEYKKLYKEISLRFQDDKKFNTEEFIYQTGQYTSELLFPLK